MTNFVYLYLPKEIFYSMSQIREKVKEEDINIKSRSAHHSQSDSAKGYGGTYGVLKDRQDKVCVCFKQTCWLYNTRMYTYASVLSTIRRNKQCFRNLWYEREVPWAQPLILAPTIISMLRKKNFPLF